VSGHSHTKLAKPITVGDTVICSAGEYGQNLGMLTLNRNSSGNWTKLQYRLIPINSNLTGDAALNRRIEQFKSIVQESYLDSLGLTFDGKLAHSAFDFPTLAQMYDQHAEQTLGNLVSDAYIYAVQQAEGANYEPVAAAIVPNGTIRASLVRGDITVSDAFNVSSLGIGPDKRSGYPLISIYLTGQELKTACEVDASIAPIMKTAQLYMSGMTYTFNPKRLLFNKITHVALQNPDGSIQEIEDDRLYRVAAGLYSAQMLSVVGDKSFGLLSIVPKTREGLPIRDFEAQIIRDTKNGGEIKEWMALAQYLQSFVQVNGVAQIPAYYDKKQGRKIIDDRAALSAILTQPNKLALAFYGLIMLILILITLALRRVLKRRPQIAKQTPPL
jgi:2',3'-cyclic-nucleotide 2'-phosphodiesterase (5'-nucleotidase family)